MYAKIAAAGFTWTLNYVYVAASSLGIVVSIPAGVLMLRYYSIDRSRKIPGGLIYWSEINTIDSASKIAENTGGIVFTRFSARKNNAGSEKHRGHLSLEGEKRETS